MPDEQLRKQLAPAPSLEASKALGKPIDGNRSKRSIRSLARENGGYGSKWFTTGGLLFFFPPLFFLLPFYQGKPFGVPIGPSSMWFRAELQLVGWVWQHAEAPAPPGDIEGGLDVRKGYLILGGECFSFFGAP